MDDGSDDEHDYRGDSNQAGSRSVHAQPNANYRGLTEDTKNIPRPSSASESPASRQPLTGSKRKRDDRDDEDERLEDERLEDEFEDEGDDDYGVNGAEEPGLVIGQVGRKRKRGERPRTRPSNQDHERGNRHLQNTLARTPGDQSTQRKKEKQKLKKDKTKKKNSKKAQENKAPKAMAPAAKRRKTHQPHILSRHPVVQRLAPILQSSLQAKEQQTLMRQNLRETFPDTTEPTVRFECDICQTCHSYVVTERPYWTCTVSLDHRIDAHRDAEVTRMINEMRFTCPGCPCKGNQKGSGLFLPKGWEIARHTQDQDEEDNAPGSETSSPALPEKPSQLTSTEGKTPAHKAPSGLPRMEFVGDLAQALAVLNRATVNDGTFADALVPFEASRDLLTIYFELLNPSEQKLVHSLVRWLKHKSDVYIRSGSRRPASEQEKRDLVETYPWLWIRSNYPISEHPKDDDYQPHYLERYFESGPLGDEISKFRLVKVCEPGQGESFTVCDFLEAALR